MLIRTRGEIIFLLAFGMRENRGAGTCTKADWREGMLGKQVPGCMGVQNGALTMRENDYQPLSPFAAQ